MLELPTTGILLKGHGVLWAAGSIYYQTVMACTHVTMVCPSREITCTAVTPWAAAGNMAKNSTGMVGNSACHIGRKVSTMTQGAIIEYIPLGIHGGSPKMIHVESVNKEVEFSFFNGGWMLCSLHYRYKIKEHTPKLDQKCCCQF